MDPNTRRLLGGTGESNRWIATLGGAGTEGGNSVDMDDAGNIYVVGTTTSQGAGGNDALIAKYSPSGSILWQRSLGGTGTETFDGISVVRSSGDCYVVGKTSSQGAGLSDLLIAKYNSSGALQWQRSLGGTGDDVGRGIYANASGTCWVVGETAGSALNLLAAKYNSAGTLQWQRSLGGTGGVGNTQGYGVWANDFDQAFVVGSTTSEGAGGTDALIARYDTTGSLAWQRILGGTGNETFTSVASDGGGTVQAYGNTTSQGSGAEDVLRVQYIMSGGSLVNQSVIGTAGPNLTNGLFSRLGTSFFYVAGSSSNSGVMARMGSSGGIQWLNTMDGSGLDSFRGISIDSGSPETRVVACGVTGSAGAGGLDLLLVSLDAAGGGQGTFGAFTYASSSPAESTSTLTNATSTLTSTTTTLTDSATTLTDAARTLTSTVIPA